MNVKNLRVVIVYDRVNKWGGAERVLLALHDIFPDAPLFTSVYNSDTTPWAKVFLITTSFLQKIPFTKSHHEYFPFLMPLAFESFSFDEFDLVISVTSEAAKGIITKPQTKHICLCLTPTRYLWSGYKEYFKNVFLKIFSFPFIWYLQKWDKIASKRPDAYIAISHAVQKRIAEYYGRESTVIYPGVTITTRLKIDRANSQGSGRFFLVVSRLSKFTNYKRIDIAVKAATKLRLPLVVIGEGNINYLKKFAGPTVRFVGKVTDEELVAYYADCKALIFPGEEDFGLVMVEAQILGKPVIAYRGGGAVEIVKEGKTGMFFNKQTRESLVEVLKSFNEHDYNSQVCRTNGEKFSKEKFQREILSFVEKI